MLLSLGISFYQNTPLIKRKFKASLYYPLIYKDILKCEITL